VLRREFANTVDFIRKYRASGRLLDVGCAYGFFLQEARPYFDVAGIEIAEEAATFVGNRVCACSRAWPTSTISRNSE